MIPLEKFYRLADYNHFLFGVLAIWGPVIFFGPAYAGAQAAAFLLYAVVKEAWWDEKYETKDECGSGWRDFLGYFLGVFIALGLLKLKFPHAMLGL